MDFINNISYNNILIIIKYFIKYNKFIPINKFYLTKDFADIIIREIINNYRLLNEFITDRSITFASQFFITLIAKLKVNNKFSIAFHL